MILGRNLDQRWVALFRGDIVVALGLKLPGEFSPVRQAKGFSSAARVDLCRVQPLLDFRGLKP